MPCDRMLECSQSDVVAAEQIQHVLLGSHGSFDASQRIAVKQLLDAFQCHQHFVRARREPFAEGGRLRRNVMAATGHNQGRVLRS